MQTTQPSSNQRLDKPELASLCLGPSAVSGIAKDVMLPERSGLTSKGIGDDQPQTEDRSRLAEGQPPPALGLGPWWEDPLNEIVSVPAENEPEQTGFNTSCQDKKRNADDDKPSPAGTKIR